MHELWSVIGDATRWLLGVVLVTVAATQELRAQTNDAQSALSNPYIFLIRDSVVHEQLKATEQQRRAIADLTDELDGPFVALRGMTREEGVEQLARLIRTAQSRMGEILTAEQRKRLDEIIRRVHGIRVVLRDPMVRRLGLTQEQISHIQQIVQDSQQRLETIKKTTDQDQQSRNQQAARIREDEQQQILNAMDQAQRRLFVEALGASFDISSLGRISYKAPEISSPGDWINSSPLSLDDLQGKVVALDFRMNQLHSELPLVQGLVPVFHGP